MTAHLNNKILNPLTNVINLLVYTIKNAVLLWASTHAFKGKFYTILCSCVKSFQIGLKFLDQNIMSELKAKNI